jgi:EAL domain-containing protein (putative c-di-GMP-specific phosphodiesterase class I)
MRDDFITPASGERESLDRRFERAMATMWMAFQPIVHLGRRQVFGYEALLRSDEPSLSAPGPFLAAAEALGCVPELGARARLLAANAFQAAPASAALFVNLHSRELLDPVLYDGDAELSRCAQRVVLEITERSSLEDVEDVQERVQALRKLGFRIAVDDLGAGYSGLSSVAVLEPEVVKLDMSLVRDVHRSPIRQRIVEAVTSMCNQVGVLVIAEGVESLAEQESLRSSGCELLQGYLFAVPARSVDLVVRSDGTGPAVPPCQSA